PLENFIEYFQLMCTNPNRGDGDDFGTYLEFIESIAQARPRSMKEYEYMVEACGDVFTALDPLKPHNSYPYWYSSSSEAEESVSAEINFDTSGLEQVAEDLKHIATIFEGLASGELVIAGDEDQDEDWAEGYEDFEDFDEDEFDEDYDDFDEEDDDIWADDNDDFRKLNTLTEDVLIARGLNPADYTILSGRSPLDAAFGFDDEE
ncbi:MAG: hypothetical protein KBS66_08240, partial [Eubacterium sp.]|nr:hypothetical protein [Candidatus Colimonas fimequi]